MKSTKEIFLEDVSGHTMEVIADNGVNRHLRFSNGGSFNCKYDLITWGGHLCVTGDCGTYVFSRIPDMFEFFRCKKEGELSINANYWGQKLLSVCTQGGYKEFSPALLEDAVKSRFEDWEFEADEDEERSVEEVKAAVWDDLEERVLDRSHDGEVRAYDAAAAFKSDYGHDLEDIWDCGLMAPTHHYLWNLYSIVWGIKQYDKMKTEAAKSISMTVSMDGARRNLTNDINELSNRLLALQADVLNDGRRGDVKYELDQTISAFNDAAQSAGVLNCVSHDGMDDFSMLADDLTIQFIEGDDE